METPAISIISCIYKMEATIRRAVDSVLNQKFKDFELLLIDDGSPDNCPAICDEYARKDNRVKAFHKPNGGLSDARNYGIERAKGKYTIFVDPDDWIDPEGMDKLYETAEQENADMTICDFYSENENERHYKKQKPRSLDHRSVLGHLFSGLHGSTCNKLIKRELYTKYNVKNPKGIYGCEDQYVMASFLRHDIKVAYCPVAFYHYMLSADSQSRHYDEKTYAMDMRIREMFVSLFDNNDPIQKRAFESKTRAMVSRAFYFGQDFFTSKEFKRNFFTYRHIVTQCGDPKYEKCLKYLSCIGFFIPANFCFRIGFKAKRFLKRLI